MKQNLLTKTLSLAVALLLGGASSAWAAEGDNIYSNDFSTKDQTDFATWIASAKVPSGYSYTQIGRLGSFSIESGALVHTSTTAGRNNNAAANANFGTFNDAITNATKATNYVLSFDITLAITGHIGCNEIFELSDEDKKTVLCLYAIHTRNDGSTGATTWGYIVGGNNAFATKDATFTSKTNTEGSFGDGTKHNLAENISGTTGSKTYHVILDAQTNGLAKLTIKEGETAVVDKADVNVSANKGLKYVYFSGHYSGGSATSISIDNFSIVEGAPSTASTAEYTVKYVADISDVETDIKTPAVRTGIVDAAISLQDADKNSIWYSGKKYIYSSDNASTCTIANDNSTIVKVIFTEAPLYSYSVTDNLGNSLASGNTYSGENVDFYVPYYAFKSGKFYKSPSLSSGTLSYGKSTISAIAANTEIIVTYTEEENSNVVFFSEAENLTGVTVQDDGYTQIRMSNGKAGYYGTQTVFTTLPAGKYTITSATRTGTTRFYAGTVGEGIEIGSVTSSGNIQTTTSDEFILSTSTEIYTSTGNSSNYFDYVIIRKTGEVVSVDATTGFATLYTPYALDFSGVENLKAYTATVSGSTVTLTAVDDVPAGTGVVLKRTGGDATSFDIPTIASSTTDKGDLLGGDADVAFDSDTNNDIYVLAKNTDGKVQFRKLGSGSVAAGKAYLKVAKTTGAHMLSVIFDDDSDVTGINTIANSQQPTANSCYDLQGRKVAQPTKGLYIVNGKKVIIK